MPTGVTAWRSPSSGMPGLRSASATSSRVNSGLSAIGIRPPSLPVRRLASPSRRLSGWAAATRARSQRIESKPPTASRQPLSISARTRRSGTWATSSTRAAPGGQRAEADEEQLAGGRQPRGAVRRPEGGRAPRAAEIDLHRSEPPGIGGTERVHRGEREGHQASPAAAVVTALGRVTGRTVGRMYWCLEIVGRGMGAISHRGPRAPMAQTRVLGWGSAAVGRGVSRTPVRRLWRPARAARSGRGCRRRAS